MIYLYLYLNRTIDSSVQSGHFHNHEPSVKRMVRIAMRATNVIPEISEENSMIEK